MVLDIVCNLDIERGLVFWFIVARKGHAGVVGSKEGGGDVSVSCTQFEKVSDKRMIINKLIPPSGAVNPIRAGVKPL